MALMVYNGYSLSSELADLAAFQWWFVPHCDLPIAGSLCMRPIRGGSSVELTSTQASTERLALLYRLLQAINSTLDLDKVLQRVMDPIVAATRARRCCVMLAQIGGDHGCARGCNQ